MKHPIALLSAFLAFSTPAFSQFSVLGPDGYPTDDSSKVSIELALRVGSISGQAIDIEDRLYEDFGLVMVDKSGNQSQTDPVGSNVGFELDALYSFNSSFQAGIALLSQSVSIHPEETAESKFEADFLTEQAILARVRFRPLHLMNMKFGVEGGFGPCMGTLHRYALAAKNVSVITSGESTADAAIIAEYLERGNRPIDVSGIRYEASILMTRAFTKRIGGVVRLGFHKSSHDIKGDDPLEIYQRKYPSSVSSLGFDLSIGLLGTF
jgi:hypothetical protein